MLYDFFLKNFLIFIILIFIIIFLIVIELFYAKKFKNAIQVRDVLKYMNYDKAVIFDLRSESDYQNCHILDSINLPIDKVNKNHTLVKKYKNKTIILICNNNYESLKALKAFKVLINYNVFYLDGGFKSWLKESMPTTSL
ncbi:MAG TPA: rhodanese-like domain-containing protein [Candidatus Azoamicus sp.]